MTRTSTYASNTATRAPTTTATVCGTFIYLSFHSYGFLTCFQAVPLYAITRVSQRL